MRTATSIHGESFAVGDEVALRPDCEHNVRDFGVVRALGEYGPYHVEVRWNGGYTGDIAHIDRITRRNV
jgi:hypothetical protein